MIISSLYLVAERGNHLCTNCEFKGHGLFFVSHPVRGRVKPVGPPVAMCSACVDIEELHPFAKKNAPFLKHQMVSHYAPFSAAYLGEMLTPLLPNQPARDRFYLKSSAWPNKYVMPTPKLIVWAANHVYKPFTNENMFFEVTERDYRGELCFWLTLREKEGAGAWPLMALAEGQVSALMLRL